jgi:amino acid permease
MYDRDNPRYPYKSHGQWLKACYGLVACLLLVIFNGVGTFLEKPFDTRRFIASYISVGVQILPTFRRVLTVTGGCFCNFTSWLQTRETRI